MVAALQAAAMVLYVQLQYAAVIHIYLLALSLRVLAAVTLQGLEEEACDVRGQRPAEVFIGALAVRQLDAQANDAGRKEVAVSDSCRRAFPAAE
jgi:hypothetical protein